jgi:hypothetical protein
VPSVRGIVLERQQSAGTKTAVNSRSFICIKQFTECKFKIPLKFENLTLKAVQSDFTGLVYSLWGNRLDIPGSLVLTDSE